MDELEISGKRYISTRRAARDHGYHSDYMGQLIRGKKVAGQKVGRAWYIEEDSLNAYLGHAPAAAPAPKPALAEEVPVPVEHVVVKEEAPEPAVPELKLAEPAAAEVEEIKNIEIQEDKEEQQEEERPVVVHVAAPAQAEPIEPPLVQEIHHALYVEEEHETRIPIHTQAPIAQQTGGLRYAADDYQAMPLVARMPQEPATPQIERQPKQQGGKFPYKSLSVVCVIAILAAVFASNFVTASIVAGEGKAATVQYAIHW